ncbi:MAG: cytochrome C [Bacteroidetes bacterium RBG_13_42_15]|nr:MAG: cytochrome C [Bacteroidetes bacterium RBG_13_42_15]
MKLLSAGKNWITIIGLLIASINFLMIIVLFLISTIFNKNDTNLGLFIYIILPGFLLLGLIMVPAGILISRKKRITKTPGEKKLLPAVDLNNPMHRKAFIAFTIATVIILFLTTYGTIEAYHLTESVEFCGTLCHKVMEPEYTAYQNSPHANVACVDCHVGSGASWYVKSKLSGLQQVYAVATKTYPSPIETPLHDLRPARETCEKCHWPQKFYARNLQTNRYYLADSLNSEWNIILQMKIGPEITELGFAEGIHWHINPDVNIEYISENDMRELISYVKYTNKATGEVTVYRNPDIEISDSIISASLPRTMDCIDCHNRPSHKYSSPPVYFDKAMLTNEVSQEIPFIKRTAMGILRNTFTDKDTALMQIREGIINYYKSDFSGYFEKNHPKIDQSVASMQKAFSQNSFPGMKVNYDIYPNHIGHLESEGCFRCHNDSFTSDNGRKITRDCNICHTIIGQGKQDLMQFTNIREALEFQHPVDIGTAWKEANCSECHRYLY